LPLTVNKVEDIGRLRIVRASLAGQKVSIVVEEDAEIPAHPHVVFAEKGVNIYADSWRVGRET
jgi:glycerol transport system ATP-binding protein